MNVFIGCERSGIVREAFRRRGHNAWSNDLEPSDDNSPFHLKGDVLDFIDDEYWDLAIFHPECTYLTNAGSRWLSKAPLQPKLGHLYGPARWEAMRNAAVFFNKLKNSRIKKVALENPIPHKHARAIIGYYTQIVQPFWFGQPFTKATCLWLRGLPPLVPTHMLPPPYIPEVHHEAPGPDRQRNRSRTYQGFADAMAVQWGGTG